MSWESCRIAALLFVFVPAVARAAETPLSSTPASRPASQATGAEPQTLFLVQFSTGPGWVADKPPHEQLHFAAHSANLRRLRDAGLLLVGARYADKGIVIVRAVDAAAVDKELDADPSVRAGVFKAEVFEFSPFYDGCIPKPTKSRIP